MTRIERIESNRDSLPYRERYQKHGDLATVNDSLSDANVYVIRSVCLWCLVCVMSLGVYIILN